MNQIYIPSEEERIKVYKKLKTNDENNHSTANSAVNNEKAEGQQQKDQVRKFSDREVKDLINRLTKDTYRDYIVKQQVETIKKTNQQMRKRKAGSQKIQERLIRAGKQLQQKKIKMSEQQQQRELAKLQPVPSLSEKIKLKIDKPFLERIDANIDQKQILMKKLTQKYQHSFQPKLNPYSLFMAEVHNPKNFYERIKEHQEKKKQFQSEKIKQIKERQLEGATFNPKINSNSRIIRSRHLDSISQSAKSQQKGRKRNDDIQPSFRPQINKNSQLLLQKRNYSKSVCFQRLYEDNMKKIQKINELKKKAEEQNSFQPKINTKSLKILQRRRQNGQQNSLDQFEEVLFEDEKLFLEQDNFQQFSRDQSIKTSNSRRKSLKNLQLPKNQIFSNKTSRMQ